MTTSNICDVQFHNNKKIKNKLTPPRDSFTLYPVSDTSQEPRNWGGETLKTGSLLEQYPPEYFPRILQQGAPADVFRSPSPTPAQSRSN